ncbi:MAG: hypothetical protein EG823_05915 [Actinobacteria bacterium]|nr:hypothetical protein [Actinomycetota bacterium]
MLPPMLMRLHVGAGETGPGIWLPLFLVWLLLLPLLVLALCITLILDLVLFLAGQAYHHYTLLMLRAAGLLGATRGMVVHVHSIDADVDIDFV